MSETSEKPSVPSSSVTASAPVVAGPMFAIVTDSGALVVPSTTSPNASAPDGVAVSVGARLVPSVETSASTSASDS